MNCKVLAKVLVNMKSIVYNIEMRIWVSYDTKEELYVFRLDLCGVGASMCFTVPLGQQQRKQHF